MYSAIEHVAKSLCMKAEDLMAEFTVYFDDSGTHNESDIAVAACFLSDVPRWTDFEKAWNAALHDAGLLDKGFHMADFVARQSPYRWNDPSKHDEVIKKLIGIINDHALGGMVTAVSKADYDQTIQGKLREKLGSRHYTFAIQGCLAQIEEWLRESTFSGEAIGYVFDQMGKGKNEINNLFDDLLANKLAVHFGIESNGWAFGNRRRVVQLQASDVLAWEGNKFARDHHFQNLPPRASFSSMAGKVGVRHRFFYGDNLRGFARDMESRYEKCGWEAPLGGFFPVVL